ncbi:MAG: hypothetical protein ACLTSZ_10255 [Lachnospiraceae bacterium]
MWKDSEYFQITGPDTVKNALADIECNLAQEGTAEQTVWYLDGKAQDVTGAVVDAREIEEEMSGSIAAVPSNQVIRSGSAEVPDMNCKEKHWERLAK